MGSHGSVEGFVQVGGEFSTNTSKHPPSVGTETASLTPGPSIGDDIKSDPAETGQARHYESLETEPYEAIPSPASDESKLDVRTNREKSKAKAKKKAAADSEEF